ncbi:hypothetical protein [Alicyclobacillus acidiphilus]|uniref:hypothetical protein n=1 Tax=Alicyclobacillus acidiphilus TaxID=182455 RepID=UPI0008327EC6|nr:hypothetical protein [Alicyclobacillus acidiphilus]
MTAPKRTHHVNSPLETYVDGIEQTLLTSAMFGEASAQCVEWAKVRVTFSEEEWPHPESHDLVQPEGLTIGSRHL